MFSFLHQSLFMYLLPSLSLFFPILALCHIILHCITLDDRHLRRFWIIVVCKTRKMGKLSCVFFQTNRFIMDHVSWLFSVISCAQGHLHYKVHVLSQCLVNGFSHYTTLHLVGKFIIILTFSHHLENAVHCTLFSCCCVGYGKNGIGETEVVL